MAFQRVSIAVDGSPPAENAADVGAELFRTLLIVVGTHGRGGIARALIRSVAESVVGHAPCPVLVVGAAK